MIKIRARKVVRDVLARKGRTALVSIAIFIGVAGTIALFSMSDILVSQLREDVREDELSMGDVYVAAEEGAQLDDAAYLRLLSDYPGVTEVQGNIRSQPVFFKRNLDEEDFEEVYVQAYGVLNEDGTAMVDAPFDAPAPIEPMRLLSGGAWPAPSANELLVERRMADEYDLAVGDVVTMRILSPSRLPEKSGATGTTELWTISGIVFDAYAYYPDLSIYARIDDAAYMSGVHGLASFMFRFTDYNVAQDEFDDVVDLIALETPYNPVFTETEDPAESSLIVGAEMLGNLMGFLALLSLVVSGFLVINVITSLVVEQKRQIGVMKSMGATRADNFVMYSGIAFAYGLIGVIPGIIVGIPGGYAAAKILAPELNTLLEGFKISPPSILLGAFVGILVPVLASLLPVWNGTRVQILEAMTDLGINARYGSGPIARLLHTLPIPITVRQGLSNVSLKKSRLTFTVITLAIAVGAFMGIYAIFESVTHGIDQYLDSWNIELGVGPSDAREPAQLVSILEEDFGETLKTIEPGFMQQVEFEGYDPEPTAGGPPGIIAYGYDVESESPAFIFTIDEGQNLTAENKADGIVLSSLLAANMNKTVGDAVVLVVPGNRQEFKVVGISEFPLDQCWVSWDTMAMLTSYTIDTIESESPIPADSIPAEARGFLKYVTLAEVAGYESPDGEGLLPGTMVMGFSPTVAQFLQFDEGSFVPMDQPGVIITRSMAESGGYGLGDTLTLTSLTEGGNTADYPIVGIFNPPSVLQSGGMVPEDFVGMFWRDATDLDNAVVETVPRPQFFFITTNYDDPTAKQIDELYDDINEAFIKQGIPVFGFNFVELMEEFSRIFFTFQAILSSVAGLIALVGALGLLTTLSMSVFERQKEIGVMRSIGAGSATVATQFLTEGVVVGVISWIVGLPTMVLIHYALLKVTKMSETFPFEFSLEAVVIGLIGMMIITIVASLWPSLSAARKTVSDILRYQ